MNRSAALASVGRAQEALLDADKALRLAPRYPRAHLRKGNALILLQHYEEALLVITEGLQLEPANGELLAARNQASTHLGKAPQLHRSVSVPIQVPYPSSNLPLAPSPPQHYSSIASSETVPSSSHEKYTVLASSPLQSPPLPDLSVSPPHEGMVKSGSRSFINLSWLSGGRAKLAKEAHKRGLEFLAQGKPSLALTELTTAVESAAAHQYLTDRAHALLELSLPNEALEDADKALALAPDLCMGHIRKCQAQMHLNQLSAARTSLEAAKKYIQIKSDTSVVEETEQDLLQRETYMSFVFLTDTDEPPPTYTSFREEDSEEETESVVPRLKEKRAGRISQFVHSLRSSVLGEEKNAVLCVVTSTGAKCESDRFIQFELSSNRFSRLLRRFVRDETLLLTEEGEMLLHRKPLFDSNSLREGTCELALLMPQDVSLENWLIDEDFLLSHLALIPSEGSQHYENSDATDLDSSYKETFHFFTLNQITGIVDLNQQTFQVEKNPNKQPHDTLLAQGNDNLDESQILRETYVTFGDFPYVIRFFVLSNPIWISPEKQIAPIAVPSPSIESKKALLREGSIVSKPSVSIEERFRLRYHHTHSTALRGSVHKYVQRKCYYCFYWLRRCQVP